MPESCSCGAQLPPDALFCHKCGKPQREILAPEVETHAAVDVLPPPPLAALALSFRNIAAVRIALMVAATVTLPVQKGDATPPSSIIVY